MKIIIKLAGGLGNQMFQYAFGRNLAIKRNFSLYLDPFGLQNYATPREYGLRRFNISANLLEKEFVPNIMSRIIKKINEKKKILSLDFLYRWFPNLIWQIEKEKNLSYSKSYQYIYSNCVFEGFWQNQNYFSEIKDTLMIDFSLSGNLSLKNLQYFQEINKTEDSVAIHIRRGDYINNKANLSVYSYCGKKYYYAGVTLMSQQVKSPHLFIFSDDILWAKKNLRFDLPSEYIEGECQDQDIEELILMTNCKHHIIANSSFSWWGTWLCKNPDKIVIAPKSWFVDERMNSEFELPHEWIKI